MIVWSCQDKVEKSRPELVLKSVVDSLNIVVDSLEKKLQLTELLADSLKNIEPPSKIIDSLQQVIQRKNVEYSALMELDLGDFTRIEEADEGKPWAYQYRVEIYGSEIYKSVYLVMIEYVGEGVRQIGTMYEIDLDKEIGISGELTNGLEFIKWLAGDEFQLSDGRDIYTFKILSPHDVEVER